LSNDFLLAGLTDNTVAQDWAAVEAAIKSLEADRDLGLQEFNSDWDEGTTARWLELQEQRNARVYSAVDYGEEDAEMHDAAWPEVPEGDPEEMMEEDSGA
jgi:hypothetical protein